MTRRASFLLLAIVAAGGCSRREEPVPAAGPRVLRLSQRNEPSTLDPGLAVLPDDFFIIRALSEGLAAPEGAGFRPAAAERWEISPDGFTWTFHLRADGRWSNGEPVTADDFVASFRRVLTPATAAPKAELLFPVKNARAFAAGRLTDFSAVGFLATDPRTLVVTLEQPSPWFLAYAASGPWIPVNVRVLQRLGRDWTRPGSYVGNGPYLLSEWRPGQRIVVRKNPRYPGADGIRLDEIQFLRFDDGNTEDRAYRAGEVDVTMAVPASKLEPYARDRPHEIHRTPLAETHYLAFNVRRPSLADPRVRHALSLAIDRVQITRDVLRGGQEPAWRLLPAELRPAGDMGDPQPVETDGAQARAEARRLLAQAGYPGGRGFPRLELSGWARGAVLEAVQAMWKKHLGIDVRVIIRDARVHEPALRAGNYDIGFITLIPDVADPCSALERFATGAPDDYPQWSDANFDRRMAEAERTRSPIEQAAILRAAEARLLEQAPLAPLYFNAKNWLMRPTVRGWRENAWWTRDYLGLYLEPVTAK